MAGETPALPARFGRSRMAQRHCSCIESPGFGYDPNPVHSARLQRIVSLAAPIMAAMVSANVMTLVDTAMVGVLGDSALAAVGIGTVAYFMCVAPVLGVSTGVQVIAARRKGQDRHSEMALSLNAGILFALLVGVPLSGFIYLLVPWFFPHLNDDPEVVAQGVPYLRLLVLNIVLTGLKFAFRGYWNGVDLSRLYMWTLLVMHSSNVLFNYLLIFGKLGLPALGVPGAGLGTLLAHVLGVGIYFYLGWKHAWANGFLRSWPSTARLLEVARLAVPSGAQLFLTGAGFTALYKIIGLLGTAETAAVSVLVKISNVAILPATGLGVAAATLVGQAMGRNDNSDASRWAWDVVKVTVVLMIALGLPMALFPDPVLSIFLRDTATRDLARLPLVVWSLYISVEGIAQVMMHALLGAGDVRRVLAVAVAIQWLVFLPLSYLLGPILGFGILTIWILSSLLRALQMLIYVAFWRGGKWTRIKV